MNEHCVGRQKVSVDFKMEVVHAEAMPEKSQIPFTANTITYFQCCESTSMCMFICFAAVFHNYWTILVKLAAECVCASLLAKVLAKPYCFQYFAAFFLALPCNCGHGFCLQKYQLQGRNFEKKL